MNKSPLARLGGSWTWHLLYGLVSIVAGVIAVFAAADHPGLPGRGWTVFTGVLSVIAGLMLLAWPSLSLLTLSLLAGLWLVMLGAVQLSLARQLRSAVRAA